MEITAAAHVQEIHLAPTCITGHRFTAKLTEPSTAKNLIDKGIDNYNQTMIIDKGMD